MNFTGERFTTNIDGWLAFQHYHRYYFIANQLNLENKTIIDIACGEGYGSEILSKSSEFVYGIDISKESIDHAKSRYKNPKIEFLEGSVSLIPLNDNSADIVVSFETIEHHNQHQEMLSEIKRVLRSNGMLIISSPDKGFYEKHFPRYKNPYHIKELYSIEFEKLINENFKFVEVFLQNNIFGSVITSINNGNSYSRPLQFQINDGTVNEVESRFNICVASDSEFTFKSVTTFCTPPPHFDIYELIQEKQRSIEIILNSKRWKIGGILTSPFRFLKKRRG